MIDDADDDSIDFEDPELRFGTMHALSIAMEQARYWKPILTGRADEHERDLDDLVAACHDLVSAWISENSVLFSICIKDLESLGNDLDFPDE